MHLLNTTSKNIFFLVLLSLLNTGLLNGQDTTRNEISVIYGERYIFTVETPSGWINDTALARQFGIECFFYPFLNSSEEFTNYIYALGRDKILPDETLNDFIQKDLEKFKKKYPKFKYDSVCIENKEGVINSRYFSMYNLSDRYREEVLYSETESAIIVMSFTAKELSDYEKYLSAFDFFIDSFIYGGSNPEEFLESFNKTQAR